MAIQETAVSYYGLGYVEHAAADFEEIRAHHCTTVILAVTEFEFDFWRPNLPAVVAAARRAGLKVLLDPWGIGKFFGGEQVSLFLQNNLENRQVSALTGEKLNAACFNTPAFRDYFMHFCLILLREAGAKIPELSRRMQRNEAVMTGVHQLLDAAAETPNGHVAVGGTSNMLSYPEYSDVEKARGFLSLIETRDKLAKIIADQGEMAFTVRIGPETGVPEMADCSIVTATYHSGKGQQGTIGVIGPTRMQYSKVLSILGTMGQQLSRMLQEDDHNI